MPNFRELAGINYFIEDRPTGSFVVSTLKNLPEPDPALVKSGASATAPKVSEHDVLGRTLMHFRIFSFKTDPGPKPDTQIVTLVGIQAISMFSNISLRLTGYYHLTNETPPSP